MTQKRKTILILFLVLLVFIILTETGLSNLRLYNSTITSNVSGNWSNAVTVTNISSQKPGGNACADTAGLKHVPLTVYCMGYSKEDTVKGICPPVSVSVDHIDHDALWTPLYKGGDLHFTLPVSISVSSYRQMGDSLQLRNYKINGTMYVKGNFTVRGLCSYKDAKRMMIENVMNIVHVAIRAQLDEQK